MKNRKVIEVLLNILIATLFLFIIITILYISSERDYIEKMKNCMKDYSYEYCSVIIR